MFQLPVENNSTCQQAFCTRQVWEKVHVGPRVMRRGHNSSEAEVLRFPRDPPPPARNQHARPMEGPSTHWHSLGIHSNQVHTGHTSVLCSWADRHTGRWDRRRRRPHQRRHTRNLQGGGQSGSKVIFMHLRPRSHRPITPSLRLTLAVWEVVESWLAALTVLPVHTLATQAAPRSITHLPHRPPGVAHTL